jgi:predicted metal-binding membrane protein
MLIARDRLIVLAGLVGITALAWGYVLLASSTAQAQMAMDATRRIGGAREFWLTFGMWAGMMVAMMLPSALPAILMFASIGRQAAPREPLATTIAFVTGYLTLWFGFSLLAALAQWGWQIAPLDVSSDTASIASGGLLILAGLFQWSPLKHACLAHCRSPQGFFMTEWRKGIKGAFNMGMKHGRYCVGCCWALMTLLFIAGAMNPLWMMVITLFVLVEKIGPRGGWVSRFAGLALISWGVWAIAA